MKLKQQKRKEVQLPHGASFNDFAVPPLRDLLFDMEEVTVLSIGTTRGKRKKNGEGQERNQLCNLGFLFPYISLLE